jgi:hypothetical protein
VWEPWERLHSISTFASIFDRALFSFLPAFLSFFLSCGDPGLNSGLHTCRAGALLIEPHHFALIIFEIEVSRIVCLG